METSEEATFDTRQVYRIGRRDILGYRYSMDYDLGKFIHVRILEGPNSSGEYKCTTRGQDGRHLGPGGGWDGESVIDLSPSDLERV